MAETFHFSLVSPERQLLSEEVEQVVVPGSEGQFTVLPRHAPVMTSLQPGVVEVRVRSGHEQRICVFGGFAEVSPEGLTVLAEKAFPVADLDPELIDREIRDTEEDVTDAVDDATRLKAETRLSQLRTMKDALAA